MFCSPLRPEVHGDSVGVPTAIYCPVAPVAPGLPFAPGGPVVKCKLHYFDLLYNVMYDFQFVVNLLRIC